MAAFQASAASADWSKVQNFAIDLNDEPGADKLADRIRRPSCCCRPIRRTSTQSAAVKKFFDWGFAHGSDIAKKLLYIPLPATVHDAIRAAWQKDVPGTM